MRVALDALVFTHSQEDCCQELTRRAAAAGGGPENEARLQWRLKECALGLIPCALSCVVCKGMAIDGELSLKGLVERRHA